MDWSHFLTKSVAVKQFNSLKLMFYSHKFNQSSHKAYSKVSDLLCFLSGFEFQEALNTDIPALLERVSQKREEMIQQGMPGAELWMHWIERWKTDAAEMGKKETDYSSFLRIPILVSGVFVLFPKLADTFLGSDVPT